MTGTKLCRSLCYQRLGEDFVLNNFLYRSNCGFILYILKEEFSCNVLVVLPIYGTINDFLQKGTHNNSVLRRPTVYMWLSFFMN